MVDATRRRSSPLSRGVQRGQRQADVDRTTDCIANGAARPDVEDHRNIGEALDDGDIGDVGDPELVRSVDDQVFGSIGIDRLIVIAVGGRDIPAAAARLKCSRISRRIFL
jgi:hypothetical protein